MIGICKYYVVGKLVRLESREDGGRDKREGRRRRDGCRFLKLC